MQKTKVKHQPDSSDTGREARLLELAYELEEAQPWARIQDS